MKEQKLRSNQIVSLAIASLFACLIVFVSAMTADAASVGNAKGRIDSYYGVNMRTGPGTSSKIIMVIPDNAKITIIEEKFTSKTNSSSVKKWYRISYNGKKGYIRSDLVDGITYSSAKLTSSPEKYVNYRSGAGTSMAKRGYFNPQTTVTAMIKARAYGSTELWYRVKVGSRYYYSSADLLGNQTPAPAPAENPAKKPAVVTKTAVTTNAGNVQPAKGRITSDSGVNMRSGASTSAKVLTIIPDDAEISILEEKFVSKSGSAKENIWFKITYAGKTGYVRSDLVYAINYSTSTAKTTGAVNYRVGAGTGMAIRGKNYTGTKLVIVMKARPYGSSGVWYKIKVGNAYYYSSSKYFGNLRTVSTAKFSVSYNDETSGGGSYSSNTSTDNSNTGSGTTSPEMGNDPYKGVDFERYMKQQGFPESYKAKIRALHKAHPNWVFVAKKTGINFGSAVDKECRDEVSLINYVYPKSWRDKSSHSYWGGFYIPKDGLTWFNANKSVVKYYMDPRNFLNEDRIYMFENLRYHSYQSASAVSKILSGTALAKAKYKADWYVSAGKRYNISPIHLAARSREEVGGGSIACSGYNLGGVTYYNPFNIGATTSINPVMNGMKYAQRMGWNTKQKAINGAAKTLSDSYLNNNQYTLYYQRFNVANGLSRVATHQYMTNILAPYSESLTTKEAYARYGIREESLVFEIPVYTKMPSATKLPR